MNATPNDFVLESYLHRRGIPVSLSEARTLRLAQYTLHRWAEDECGGGNNFASWAIERDETTGKPYRVTYPHQGKSYRTKIADKESAALKRVAALCAKLGLSYYHQTDPRGCALYVAREPLTDQNYSTAGVACTV